VVQRATKLRNTTIIILSYNLTRLKTCVRKHGHEEERKTAFSKMSINAYIYVGPTYTVHPCIFMLTCK